MCNCQPKNKDWIVPDFITVDMGDVHEVYDDLDEAKRVREEYVLAEWEDSLQ